MQGDAQTLGSRSADIGSFATARIGRAHRTDPLDMAAWELGARACYRLAGVEFPSRVIKVHSPTEMVSVARDNQAAEEDVLSRWEEVIEPYRDVLDYDSIRTVAGQIDQAIRAGRDAYLQTVPRSLWSGALGPVSATVGGAVSDALAWSVTRKGWPLDESFGDWLNCEPTAWLACLRNTPNLSLDPEVELGFEAIEAANSNACIWWPGATTVIVCDRPEYLRFESYEHDGVWPSTRRQTRGLQLHSANGPAVRWRDGTEAFYRHGQLQAL